VVGTIEQWHLDARGEHEVVHNQLAAAIEHIQQARLVPHCPSLNLKENDYEQRRSQVRVLPSAPQKYLQNAVIQEEEATKFALRSVARRHLVLSEEIAELDARLEPLVADAVPGLVLLPGIGTRHAATLLVLAGDNPERLKSEASFASLCGVSPVEASSSKVVRHRLNRGGNRDANRALHMSCVVRMGFDQRTREYVARRSTEGKSKREIMRCLKRYVAREVYRVLLSSAVVAPSLIEASMGVVGTNVA
jgi:transposase